MKNEFFEIGLVDDYELKFAVINSFYKGKWLYVRHKVRKSWEIAGGHREPGETIDETAKRELFEETGAKEFNFVPICDYSMNTSDSKTFGRLYFARVKEIGQLPISEISEMKLFNDPPKELTYFQIQPLLFEKKLSF